MRREGEGGEGELLEGGGAASIGSSARRSRRGQTERGVTLAGVHAHLEGLCEVLHVDALRAKEQSRIISVPRGGVYGGTRKVGRVPTGRRSQRDRCGKEKQGPYGDADQELLALVLREVAPLVQEVLLLVLPCTC